MKKILALILAMVMVFALAACGSNETGTSTTPNTENTNQTETTDKVMTPDELQKYYEGYFASDDVGFAGECMTADTEGMKVIISTNKDGEGLFSMTVGENQFEIYKAKDKTEYIYAKIAGMEASGENEAVEAVDAWYKYVPAEDSENKEMFSSMSEDFDTEELKVEADDIKSVKYEKTENGIDYITVVSTELEVEEGVTLEGAEPETYEVTWTFGIDAKTHKIVSASQTEDGVVSTITFSPADEIKVTIPESVETIDEEGVMGVYMAIIFSMMGNAMGGAQ